MELPDMTDAQVKRQVLKVRDVIFEEIVEMDDGKYTGDVSSDVKDIMKERVPLDRPLNEEEFANIIVDCIETLVEWIMQKTKGVDVRIAKFFAIDFVNQTVAASYQMQYVNGDTAYDPMFG
tara:strand:+ start:1522 stop:1884 length:363 start_codon:yes stop_codon:yes gene_type:complete